jgi:hypothetical protein
MRRCQKRVPLAHLPHQGTAAQFLGTVSATDEQEAIKKGIAELEIKDPKTQKRLVALR